MATDSRSHAGNPIARVRSSLREPPTARPAQKHPRAARKRSPCRRDDHGHVQCRQGIGPVRDDDDDALLAAQGFDRTDKGILAVGVEIGVGFVEDDEERTAENGPCQTDPLSLSGRQCSATFPEPGVIAVGQAQDHIVRTGHPCGFQNCLRCRRFVEARDVCRDGSVEQRDVLRQIADVASKIVKIPSIDWRAVEPHGARGGRPYSHERFGE